MLRRYCTVIIINLTVKNHTVISIIDNQTYSSSLRTQGSYFESIVIIVHRDNMFFFHKIYEKGHYTAHLLTLFYLSVGFLYQIDGKKRDLTQSHQI